jgi:nucleotide-binding universal stress UspA family protein
MPAIRSILCPVDFSPVSEHALRVGLAFGREVGASVTVLHVVRVPDPLIAKKDFVDYLAGTYQAQLQSLIERVSAPGDSHTFAYRQGDPVGEIVSYAETIAADLIVMGTHSRTGMARLLLGTVAERVLRLSTVPVLTIPGAHDETSPV